MSPTQRTLLKLRKEGWTAEVVERHNTFSRKKHDLFGCIDIVAVHPALGIMGVQATSGTNLAARVCKSKECPGLKLWLNANAAFEVWGWRKLKNGKPLWQPKRIRLSLAH